MPMLLPAACWRRRCWPASPSTRISKAAPWAAWKRCPRTHFRLGAKGEKDQDGRNRQANWYYFRVDGADSKELTLDMVDLPGEYNYRPNQGAITKDTPPVISYDRRTWKHVETFTYDPAGAQALAPHHTRRAAILDRACASVHRAKIWPGCARISRRHPDFQEQVIGKTLGHRDLLLWTITTGAPRRRQADGVADVPPAQLGNRQFLDGRRRGARAITR